MIFVQLVPCRAAGCMPGGFSFYGRAGRCADLWLPQPWRHVGTSWKREFVARMKEVLHGPGQARVGAPHPSAGVALVEGRRASIRTPG